MQSPCIFNVSVEGNKADVVSVDRLTTEDVLGAEGAPDGNQQQRLANLVLFMPTVDPAHRRY
jgi:hypothetical protein